MIQAFSFLNILSVVEDPPSFFWAEIELKTDLTNNVLSSLAIAIVNKFMENVFSGVFFLLSFHCFTLSLLHYRCYFPLRRYLILQICRAFRNLAINLELFSWRNNLENCPFSRHDRYIYMSAYISIYIHILILPILLVCGQLPNYSKKNLQRPKRTIANRWILRRGSRINKEGTNKIFSIILVLLCKNLVLKLSIALKILMLQWLFFFRLLVPSPIF